MLTKNKTKAKVPAAPADIKALIEGQPSKADVKRALGKEPDGVPVTGRLDKEGKTREKAPIGIVLPKYELRRFYVRGSEGSSLILHRWGVKAIRQMLGKHMTGEDMPLEDKVPFDDFRDTLYRDTRTGDMTVRSIMFKAAMLAALRDAPGVTKIDAITGITVVGEYSPIYGQPTNRMDPVKIGVWPNVTSDIRFRGEYRTWIAELTFKYNTRAISLEAITNLLIMAGALYGIGEWRVTRNGMNGLFELIPTGDEKELLSLPEFRRWKVDELTPENTGTDAILEEYGLDEETLKQIRSTPRSQGRPDGNKTEAKQDATEKKDK